jgi:hypothetical protein
MNRAAIAAITVSLLAAASMRAQPVQNAGLVGAYQAARVDEPLVLQARKAIQKHFRILRLGKVVEAYTQVVAGTNVKIICTVKGEAEPSQWEFVVWRKLDQSWQFQSCARVSMAK